MKISASKLIANRRNALKFTGPRSAEGKLASSRNAKLHGLSAQASELEVVDSRAEALISGARALGFSLKDARHLALMLLRGREVINAKHSACEPSKEPEPDPVAERIDAHRKLMRHEQRAGNQIRQATRIKK